MVFKSFPGITSRAWCVYSTDPMTDDLIRWEIDRADSWSVEYRGTPYDDARRVEGRWYYRDLLTREYRVFTFQHDVMALSRNPPKE